MIESIYEDAKKNISITIDKNYSQKFLEIAESTLFGTEGIVYKMNNLSEELNKLKKPIFVSLKENDEIATICVLNQKQIIQNNCTFNAFYRCLLATHPQKTNKGYATLIINQITEYIFSKYEKALIYSYVEEDNKRSRRVLQKANYIPITTFIVPSYVCLKPQFNKNVINLSKEDKLEVLGLLNKQYGDRSFVDINESFDSETYYVLKENNEIKAGLQVKILNWSFLSLAGFVGFVMMKMVPNLPIIKKIFNPKNHSFLKIGNIYMADNASFTVLLNSILFKYKLNTCLAYTNPNSVIDSKIIEEMNKGVLSSTDSKVIMFYKTKNVSITDINKPPFLSLADSI